MAMKSYWLWWSDKKWIDFVLSPGFRGHHQLIMDNPYLESWTKGTKLLLNNVAKISKRAWTEYTHLIPERRSTTCLWAGNWKQSPEIKWKLQTRHPHSSVQFPFFPYWYHFPFHLSNLHWNILIDFKAQFPIPLYSLMLIQKSPKYFFILHLRLFSAISSQKKVGMPQLRQVFNFGCIFHWTAPFITPI